MSGLFLAPQRFTVSGTSTTPATAPATNLLNDAPGMVWRTTDVGGAYLVVATNGRPLDTIALIGSNLRLTDTLHVQGASSASMANPIFQRDMPAFTGIAGKNGAVSLLLLEMPVACAFIRIDIASLGNPAGFVEAQRLVMGQRLTVQGIDIGAERGWQDGSTSEEALGGTIFDPQRRRDTWKASVSNVSEADFWTRWDPFFTTVGISRGFLFVPDIASAYLQNQACFGRITSQAKGKAVSSDLLSLDINITQV